ncbi:hypothetical protein AB5I41_28035 [Sphingomonas sp. MMS24-JH45]
MPAPVGRRRLGTDASPALVDGASRCILSIADPDGERQRRSGKIRHALSQVHGVTAAEAEVAIRLMDGLSPETIASERRIDQHNPDQIRSLLDKTNVEPGAGNAGVHGDVHLTFLRDVTCTSPDEDFAVRPRCVRRMQP